MLSGGETPTPGRAGASHVGFSRSIRQARARSYVAIGFGVTACNCVGLTLCVGTPRRYHAPHNFPYVDWLNSRAARLRRAALSLPAPSTALGKISAGNATPFRLERGRSELCDGRANPRAVQPRQISDLLSLRRELDSDPPKR